MPIPGGATIFVSGKCAQGTVTFTGLPDEDETVTFNGVVFTFVATAPTTLDPDAPDVEIGASAAATATNLKNAMVAAAVENADLQPFVFEVAAGVVTITARIGGTAANSYTLAEAATNVAVSGATLAGGAATNGYGGGTLTLNLVGPDGNNQAHTTTLSGATLYAHISTYCPSFTLTLSGATAPAFTATVCVPVE